MGFYELRDLFRQVFAAEWNREELNDFDELREKFAFHMASICGSLPKLAEIYAGDIATADVSKVRSDVDFFINDAMPHLIAASHIFGHIPQIFEEQNGVHEWTSIIDDDAADAPQTDDAAISGVKEHA